MIRKALLCGQRKRSVAMPEGNSLRELIPASHNFIFIGEAGCGKSEIAINLAIHLADSQDKPVHFFDLDQTKPLFRSRDAKHLLAEHGIIFHHEEQFYDTPTVTGGVSRILLDKNCYAILDVGGNENGARVLGGFSKIINHNDSAVFFIINPYLPWSEDVHAIDVTMSAILQVSRIKNFRILSNPNMGCTTTSDEFLAGIEKTAAMISQYRPIAGTCVMDTIYDEVRGKIDIPLFPIHLYLTYPWINQ